MVETECVLTLPIILEIIFKLDCGLSWAASRFPPITSLVFSVLYKVSSYLYVPPVWTQMHTNGMVLYQI